MQIVREYTSCHDATQKLRYEAPCWWLSTLPGVLFRTA